MANNKKQEWKKEFRDEFSIHFDKSELQFVLEFIEEKINQAILDERTRVINIIEDEKEIIFNSEKFYGNGEDVFELLSKIQDKLNAQMS